MMKKIPFSYRITIIYVVLGVLWILFSDKLMLYITNEPHRILLLSNYKGWFYVLITGILLFFLIQKEIHRRNLLVQELLNAKKKAEESDRLKTTFLSNLSHYIRTPMNGILGFVELLEDKDTNPENHQLFLSYINERSRHLLQTLNSIIEISKIQEGQAQLVNKSLRINELLEIIVSTAMIDLAKKAKPIAIKTNYGLPDGHDVICSDKEKIYQILSNLVNNALNFTDVGEVYIEYLLDNENLVFKVKDTGKGVPEKRKDNLFSDFLYSTSTTITRGEGAGLGLPLSAGLAKLMGGKLWLESTGNAGSTFCLSIPNMH